jgi:tetratricopeptide (TPR) repeat protein
MQAACLIFMALFSAAGTNAGTIPRNAGSKYFDEADRILTNNWNANVTALAEAGWAAVRTAGPADPGFLDGVYTAARLFRVLGRDLKVESVYAQAMTACEGSALEVTRARLRLMLAHELIGQRENVKAEDILRSTLSSEERLSHKGVLYVAFVQSLAFVREQEGDLDEAERLYKTTLGYAAPDLTGVVINRLIAMPGPPVPPIGEPRATLAGFYLTHERTTEAEHLYREAVEQAALDSTARLDALRQLSGFLAFHGSKEEALATERQVVSLVEAQRDRNPDFPRAIVYERNALAERLTEAGHEAEAKTILEEDLIHAEPKGRESPEYQGALSWLLHNRIQAKDYDAAEKLAKEAVRLAESDGAAPDSAQWRAAISTLAEVRRDQGYAAEAEELTKRSLAPQEPEGMQKCIAAVDALIRSGRPQEAVVEIQHLAEAMDSSNRDYSFNLRWLAQLFVTFGYKPEAAKVAAVAVPLEENRLRSDDPRLAYALVDWAGFYRGHLGLLPQADMLLSRAERIVRECCGMATPHMEPLLRERAWMAATGSAARIRGLEDLRNFRASVYGSNSRPVEDSTRDLAASYTESGQRQQAAKLYLDAADISARRTGGRGFEHVQLLDTIASEFAAQGDLQMALALNQRALERATGFARADELRQIIEKHHAEIQLRLRAP